MEALSEKASLFTKMSMERLDGDVIINTVKYFERMIVYD
jgi:hypothetical protein